MRIIFISEDRFARLEKRLESLETQIAMLKAKDISRLHYFHVPKSPNIWGTETHEILVQVVIRKILKHLGLTLSYKPSSDEDVTLEKVKK